MGAGPRTVFAMLLVSAAVAVVAGGADTPSSAEAAHARLQGEGSSWAAQMIDAARVDASRLGLTIDYSASGSTAGRRSFLRGTTDFAVSDVPFQFEPEDGSLAERPSAGTYTYLPATAGGTAFVYNLDIDGQPVTNLRLSGDTVARIFTGLVDRWDDPAIAADNPRLALPDLPLTPVVRSDGAGSTAHLTTWLAARHGDHWKDYCTRTARAPDCVPTSYFPAVGNMVGQSGDLGVAGYVSQAFARGSIGYVNYSYALSAGFPVAKLLNAAGYYTEPTPENVAVSLLQARVATDQSNLHAYLTQDLHGVYTDTDPRNYQLSSYSYFIVPTALSASFGEDKGRSLAFFLHRYLCPLQKQAASLGYAPLPMKLAEAGLEQIRRIPGADPQSVDIETCDNPTFSPDGTNVLAANAPQPKTCDHQGPDQCPDGTGGNRTPTPAAPQTTTPTTTTTTTIVPATTTPVGGTATGAPARGTLPQTGSDDPAARVGLALLLLAVGRILLLTGRETPVIEP